MAYHKLMNGLGKYLIRDLAERATTEIRRNLEMNTAFGRVFCMGAPGMPDAKALRELIEILAIPERLGIELGDGGALE